jgi:hypothetical protein
MSSSSADWISFDGIRQRIVLEGTKVLNLCTKLGGTWVIESYALTVSTTFNCSLSTQHHRVGRKSRSIECEQTLHGMAQNVERAEAH